MEWVGRTRREKIADSQMEEGGTFQSGNSRKDFGKRSKRGDNVGSPTEDVDTEMRKARMASEGLAESKHAVKELTEEEVKKIVKEIGLVE